MNYVIKKNETVWDQKVQHKYKTMVTCSLGIKNMFIPVSELNCCDLFLKCVAKYI